MRIILAIIEYILFLSWLVIGIKNNDKVWKIVNIISSILWLFCGILNTVVYFIGRA